MTFFACFIMLTTTTTTTTAAAMPLALTSLQASLPL